MTASISLSITAKYPPLPKKEFLAIRLLGFEGGEAIAFFMYGDKPENCRFARLSAGEIETQEFDVEPDELVDGPITKKHPPTLLKVESRLALLINNQRIVLVDDELRPADQLNVENPLGQVRDLSSGRPVTPRPDLRSGSSNGTVVPIRFSGIVVQDYQHLGLLQIEASEKRARWVGFGDTLLHHFSPEDFPQHHLPNESPILTDVAYMHDRLHIYTVGNSSNYMKYGMSFHGIASYDAHRRLIGKPYFEVDDHQDEKRRGRMGQFTSSQRYCILTPYFPSSDPWKKKQRLFDLKTNEIIDVTLPRGYSKYEIVDHAGDTFWLVRTDQDNFQIAAVKVA